MSKVPLTQHGADQLQVELKRLKSQDRPQVVQAIAEARAHGDLKENAEYHAAKDQQGFIEARIKHLEGVLSHAEIIDVTKLGEGGKVVFGATVSLYDEDEDSEVTYRIVGDDEADISKGLVSISSPIARGLISKEEGDEAEIETPGGAKHFEILSVKYL
jgi:transcription elongation factor GreA